MNTGPPPARREIVSRRLASCRNAKEALMAIVAGFDVHRRQITFDALDTETGEVSRGRIDASPAAVGLWTERLHAREVHVAVEACTGCLFVCDAGRRGGDATSGRAGRDTRAAGASGGPRPIAKSA